VFLNINFVSDILLEISQRHSGTSEKNGALGLKSPFNVRTSMFLVEIKGTDANGVKNCNVMRSYVT